MKRLLCVWLSLIPILVRGDVNPDSLRQLLQQQNLSDAIRWDALEALSSYYRSQIPDSALYFAEEFYAKAQAQQDQQVVARALTQQAEYHSLTGNYEEALSAFNSSLAIYEALGNDTGIANNLNAIGIVYGRQNNLIQAMRYFQRCQAIHKRVGNQLERANVLNNIGTIYKFRGEYDSALFYIQLSLEIYDHLGEEKRAATTRINLGNIYSDQGNYAEALTIYQHSLAEVEALGDQPSLALVLSNIGHLKASQGDFDTALTYYERSLAIYEQLGDRTSMVRLLNNIGQVHRNRGDIERALDAFKRGLNLLEGQENSFYISGLLHNIGVIYLDLEDYELALTYFFQALEINERAGNPMSRANLYGSLGDVYRATAEYDTALTYYSRSLEAYQTLGVQYGIAQSHQSIAAVYHAQEAYGSALQSYRQGQQIYEELGNQLGIASGLAGMGEIHSQLGDLTQARLNGERALPIAQEVGNIKLLEDVSLLLYNTYKAQGNSRLALEMYELNRDMEDSLNSTANQRASIAYEYDRQALQDSLAFVQQQAEAEIAYESQLNRRNQLLLGAVILLLIAGIAFLFFRYRQQLQVRERKLELAQERAEKEKLAELDEVKTQLYTNITHEFRTPLTVILGNAEQIETDSLRQPIQRNGQQLLTLVNQMLDLSKLESGKLALNLTQGDVITYLRYLLESFHSLAEAKEVQLQFESSREELIMDYDPSKLMQIVSNLLSNAIKFTPAAGEVALAVGSKEAELHLQVSDSGVGIPADQLPHIFDRFYQVDSSTTRVGEGTGIGLTLTRELVQLMGGRIAAKSQVGVGTHMEVWLPIRHEAKVSIDLAQASIPPLPPAQRMELETATTPDDERPLVLIVEDNLDVVQFLQSCLRSDYQLAVAQDGEEGISQAIERTPDLIITDVMMPRKDGFALTQALKTDSRTSHIPIVMLTARADVASKIEGLERGADAYLPKPFDRVELLVRLRKLLELRKRLQTYYLTLPAEAAEDLITPPEAVDPAPAEPAFIRELRAYLETNLTDNTLTVDHLCREVGMSQSQLHRKLKALTGYSPNQYIRYIRLEKAKNLLQHSDLQVSEVAYSVGFNDPYYFSRVFKKDLGISPSDFREQGTIL